MGRALRAPFGSLIIIFFFRAIRVIYRRPEIQGIEKGLAIRCIECWKAIRQGPRRDPRAGKPSGVG